MPISNRFIKLRRSLWWTFSALLLCLTLLILYLQAKRVDNGHVLQLESPFIATGFSALFQQSVLPEVNDGVRFAGDDWPFAFMAATLLFAALLWRCWRVLRSTLGGSLREIGEKLVLLERRANSEESSVASTLAAAHMRLDQLDRERLDADDRSRRMTRLYTALVRCNQSVSRCKNEHELFSQVCRDVVAYGDMKTAWICLLDESGRQLLPAASSAGEVEWLEWLQVTVDETDARGRGPCGTAFREDRPFWCQDFQHDPATVPWHAHGLKHGWRAGAALPLHRNGVVIGTFSLYAGELDAFDADARTLLTGMAEDIDLALNRFALEAQQQQSRQMRALRIFMLELITSGMPFKDILSGVVHKLESLLPGSLCSVLLLDRDARRLRVGAAPSLPPFYNTTVDGVEIGPGVGSCGNAVYTGKRSIAGDIASDPHWEPFRSLAQEAGLAACWSEPIRSGAGKVPGAFAIYHRKPSLPSAQDIQLLEMVAHFLALAIEREQSEAFLRKLSQAVEQSANAVLITDLDATLEYANAAFLKNTGYNLSEIIGKNPRLHQSGKTPRATYDDMWAHLKRGDSWQGEFVNVRKDGTERIDLVRISPVREPNGRITHYLAIEEDVTEKRHAEARIEYLAHFDSLTGLPNRAQLEDRANFAWSLARRNHEPVTVMFLDLDHFKSINDSLGHSVGDELLAQLAKRLRELLRDDDTVSRVGGDEFILLLYGTSRQGAKRVAQKLLEAVTRPYRIGQYDLNVTCSIGISIFPDDGATLETLSRNADGAMYRAKQEGRNNFRFFTPEMQAHAERQLELVNALRHALERNQLRVVYQPQVSVEDGRTTGAEALVRWRHPEFGDISPSEFIPLAEDSGLILTIGEWVLRSATRQASEWHKRGLGELLMAVNLSAVQFRRLDLPDMVMHILAEAKLPAKYLELELTEGVATHDPQGAIAMMNELDARGVRMAIDDFGTGYSSLNYLKKFSAHKLKIDQSFVRDITNDSEDRAIVSAIIGMADSLGMSTLAEGVETPGQLAFLRAEGCDEAQGYYFSKPLSPAQFEARLREEMARINAPQPDPGCASAQLRSV